MSKSAIALAVVALIGAAWVVRSLQADGPGRASSANAVVRDDASLGDAKGPERSKSVDAESIARRAKARSPVVPPLSRWAPKGKGRLLLPGGRAVAALNGVEESVELLWPTDLAWSPIIATERSGGLEYYVHADGSRSTTQMLYRSDLGREAATSAVYNPTKAAQTQFDK